MSFHQGFTFGLLLSTAAIAADSGALTGTLQKELAQRYPGTRIELTTAVQFSQGRMPEEIASLNVLSDNGRGELQFEVRGADYSINYGWVRFSAWMPAYIATHRIHPGERLTPDSFTLQEVNLSNAQVAEYRGVILPKTADLSTLEARQTVMEGQFLVTNAVEKIPDVRRGDLVQIRLFSGGLTLTTQGMAEEPGYLNGQIRVMAAKTKRELVGKIQSGGIVEVRL
ncbi:MAG: flagellar basal body P-ring formation chaperone FlgA [Bdellovibrionota bacterium]